MGPNALFPFNHFINMTILNPFIKFRSLPYSSSTGINTIGLLADALLSWFLHRHLDNFIVT
jgi:hypothetical protein